MHVKDIPFHLASLFARLFFWLDFGEVIESTYYSRVDVVITGFNLINHHLQLTVEKFPMFKLRFEFLFCGAK